MCKPTADEIDRDDDEARSPQYGDPCPRCDKPLMAFSPGGHGNAACDDCQLYWD